MSNGELQRETPLKSKGSSGQLSNWSESLNSHAYALLEAQQASLSCDNILVHRVLY